MDVFGQVRNVHRVSRRCQRKILTSDRFRILNLIKYDLNIRYGYIIIIIILRIIVDIIIYIINVAAAAAAAAVVFFLSGCRSDVLAVVGRAAVFIVAQHAKVPDD